MTNEDLDFVKARTEDISLSSYRNCNNVLQHLSKEEYFALQNVCKNRDIVIHKSDEGDFVVIVKKTDYLNKMENLLNDVLEFEKINFKNDRILSFVPPTKKDRLTIF